MFVTLLKRFYFALSYETMANYKKSSMTKKIYAKF